MSFTHIRCPLMLAWISVATCTEKICPAQSMSFYCDLLTPSDNDPFFRDDFLEMFRGHKLLLIGDSLMSNIWENMVCSLSRNTAVSVQFREEREKIMTDCSPIPRCRHALKQTAYFEEYDIYIYQDTIFNGAYFKTGYFNMFLEGIAFGSGDVVIVNFGLHYNDYAGQPSWMYDRGDYYTHLGYFKQDMAAFDSKDVSVFFLESTPQHFGTTGYYMPETDIPCKAYKDIQSAGWNDFRNIMALNALYEGNNSIVPIIKVADRLFSDWNMHVDHHVGDLKADCTHWCLYSDAINYVSGAIYNNTLDAMTSKAPPHEPHDGAISSKSLLQLLNSEKSLEFQEIDALLVPNWIPDQLPYALCGRYLHKFLDHHTYQFFSDRINEIRSSRDSTAKANYTVDDVLPLGVAVGMPFRSIHSFFNGKAMIKVAGNPAVYATVGRTKANIPSYDIFVAMGGSSGVEVYTIPACQLNTIPTIPFDSKDFESLT